MKIGSMNTSRSVEAIRQLRQESGGVVLPSLLLCDFGNLKKEIASLEEAGVKGLHLDVMDGHFVPNLTYGMPIVEGIRRLTDLPIDVHLMITNPADYISQFVDAGADCLTIHAEIEGGQGEILESIRALGVAAGLALNPATSLESVANLLDACDLLLVMSVDAGFGGQAFNPVALEKLQAVKASHEDLLLEVDGGINHETIAACYQAGAELFVVGSAIFGETNYREAVEKLSEAIGK
jgi:ribulose-phosphate 3-epimerase